MKKREFNSYDEFLEFQRNRAKIWYQKNKEWKKAYQNAKYKGETLTREQFEKDRLKDLEK